MSHPRRLCPVCEHLFVVTTDPHQAVPCPNCMAAVPPPRTPDLTPAAAPTFDLPPYVSRRIPGGNGPVGLAVALVLGLALGLALVTSHEGRGEKSPTPRPASGWQIRPGRMTCAQWHARLEHSALGLTDTRRVLTGVDQTRFEQIVGRPTWTVQTANRVVWCYVCADGEIRLILDAAPLANQGRIQGDIVERTRGS